MQINIQSHGFTATGALRAHVTRRLQLALGCCADRVSRATVCLSDVNGPRGGVDKRCQIQVRLTALALLAWAAASGGRHARRSWCTARRRRPLRSPTGCGRSAAGR